MISSPPPGTPLAKGQAAPDFTVGSTAGPFTLSALKGQKNVLLAFFPLAFTSTCTAELCDFSNEYDRFAGENVEVFPISVDSTASLREFKNKYEMKETLLSDFKRDVSRAYGVLIPEKFYSERAYFLIGKDGRIAWSHVEKSTSDKRSNEELLVEIKKLS